MREFDLDIDGDDDVCNWLGGDDFFPHCVGGEEAFHSVNNETSNKFALVRDMNQGRWSTDISFFKLSDGRVGWYDENEGCFNWGKRTAEDVIAELEKLEAAQAEAEQREDN